MRAHYYPQLEIAEEYSLVGDSLHHLVNVIRLEVGEDLLLLNGKGLVVLTEVVDLSKKLLKLKFKKHEGKTRSFEFDLVLGMPKREALELSLKEAVELGFRNIYLVKSDYSQMRFPEEERLQNLLASALEQSNAPFLPRVMESDWKSVPWNDFSEVVLMDSQTKEPVKRSLGKSRASRLLVVGPEGGFSSQELNFLHQLPQSRVIHLPTPLLRTPTAVATGAGLLLQTLLD